MKWVGIYFLVMAKIFSTAENAKNVLRLLTETNLLMEKTFGMSFRPRAIIMDQGKSNRHWEYTFKQ